MMPRIVLGIVKSKLSVCCLLDFGQHLMCSQHRLLDQ